MNHVPQMTAALRRVRDAVNGTGWESRNNRILNTVTPGGRGLLFSHFMRSPDPMELSRDYDGLAALGYRTMDDFIPESRIGQETVLECRITAERLKVLDACGVTETDLTAPRNSLAWEREGWLEGDLTVLRRAVGAGAVTRYRLLLEAVDTGRVARFEACQAAGLHEKREIEATDVDVEVIAGIREATKLKRLAVNIARLGHDAETVKRYGAELANAYTPQQLEASPLAAEVLRELGSLFGRFTLSDVEKLAGAGFKSGEEIETMSRAFRSLHHNLHGVSDLVTARNCISAEVAAAWALSDANLGRYLDMDDLYDLQSLQESGFPTPEAMAGHRLHWQSQWEVAAKHPLSVCGSIARSGAGPTQATAMSRAGIPSYKFFEHVNDVDYWASGEPYREKFIQAHQAVAAAGWLADQLAWTYTRENYREGI